jgi:fructose-specific component phosphotransferase system IIB-like protein
VSGAAGLITSALITFDDVNTFAASVLINQANLSNALAYVAANVTTAAATVMFAYDSDSSGTADATIVFDQGTSDTVTLNAANAGLIDPG